MGLPDIVIEFTKKAKNKIKKYRLEDSSFNFLNFNVFMLN